MKFKNLVLSTIFPFVAATNISFAQSEYSMEQRLIHRALEVTTTCSGERNWYYMDITNLRYKNRRATFDWTYLGETQGQNLSFGYLVDRRGSVIVTDIFCK